MSRPVRKMFARNCAEGSMRRSSALEAHLYVVHRVIHADPRGRGANSMPGALPERSAYFSVIYGEPRTSNAEPRCTLRNEVCALSMAIGALSLLSAPRLI